MSLTEAEQEKLFKKFKKVVDSRDSMKIDKTLYNHLYLRTGFIAHYDIHGFRETFSGSGFLDFVDHFEQCFYACYGPTAEFNQRLKRYILDHADAIRQEFARKAEQKELAMLQTLAQKHGLTVLPHQEDAPAPITLKTSIVCTAAECGQYEFSF
ncbi:hypothetical protein [Paenibacillus gansuensis]|uniref:Uncharacterized protein n=1 Tax=Paenibacillus gansuensis TaxID=306542 RepID=A0ABW5PJA2_9BACL